MMTLTSEGSQHSIQFLPDYCPRCNPLGHKADSRIRLSTLTEPNAVTWRGGKRVTCEYSCAHCCHTWTRSDLWSAEQAGFDPKRGSAA